MSRGEMERTRSAFLAIHAYYTCLAGVAARAIERNTLVPEVPPLSELQVVEGWVVRKGRPVWSVDDHTFTTAQLGWSGLPVSAARIAWIRATEYRLDATRRLLDLTSECLNHGTHEPERKARLSAEIGYYGSLLEEHRRALHGKAPFPRVPDAQELEFVDGWLLWKGQPVWWSGEHADGLSPCAGGRPAAVPEAPATAPRERHSLRRLLTLPWRSAAA